MVSVIAGIVGPLLSMVGATPAVATTVSTIALYAGTTAASALIQMAMAPEVKREMGTKLRPSSGGAVPQSIVVGEKETAGSLIYAGTWGRSGKSPNTFYVRVYVLSDLPISGIKSRIWVNDKKEQIKWDEPCYTDSDTGTSGQLMGYPIPGHDHHGNHYLWVKFLDGTQTAADPYLLAKFGMLAKRPWTADMIGRGRSLMIVTQRYTVKKGNQEANVVPVLDGAVFYDWRKDSTAGGSGPQRWGERSTYTHTKNPIVILYNILRGVYRGNQWLYGGRNFSARRFDLDTWTAAANVCDQTVTKKNGETEKRCEIGAEILLNEEPLTVADRILASCNGRILESGGKVKVYCGGIGAAVHSFTDEDLIVTETITGKVFRPREEIYNAITGTYVEPLNGGQRKAYRKRTKAEYVEEDGGHERTGDMSFDYVRSATQAQRLANHALKDNRRLRTHTPAFWSWARKFEPFDVVNWSSSTQYGYTSKKFILGDVTLGDEGPVIPILREVDPDDDSWVETDELDEQIGYTEDDEIPPQVLSLTAETWAVKNKNGKKKRPAVRVRWTKTIDDDDWRYVRLQIKLKDADDDDLLEEVDADPDKLKHIFKAGILRKEDYQVRGIIIPRSQRETVWTEWIDAQSDDVKLDDEDVDLEPVKTVLETVTEHVTEIENAWASAAADLAALTAEVSEIGAEVQGFLGSSASFRDLAARLRNLSTHAMFEGALAYTDRREIVAQQNADRASFTEQITVLAGDQVALAERATALEAVTEATEASLTTLETAFTSTTEAISGAITELESVIEGKASAAALEALTTTVTDQGGQITSVAEAITEVMAGQTSGDVASVRVRMAAQSAPGGVSARYGIEVRAGASGSFQTAGMYMDVLSGGGSRIAFQTSKFMVYDGSTMVSPFIVSGGNVYMQNVYMSSAYITGYIYASQIYAPKLEAISAQLGAVNISEAVIGSLLIGTDNLHANAVTVQAGAETAGGVNVNATGFTQMQSVTVSWGSAAGVYVFMQFRAGAETEMELDLRSGGVSLPGYPKALTPKADTFTVLFDLFQSGVISGQAITFWLRRTTTGSVTIYARKMVVFVQKR